MVSHVCVKLHVCPSNGFSCLCEVVCMCKLWFVMFV